MTGEKREGGGVEGNRHLCTAARYQDGDGERRDGSVGIYPIPIPIPIPYPNR